MAMLATANVNYRRVGPGVLYIQEAPTTAPVTSPATTSTAQDYLLLFYADDSFKAMKEGVLPYATATSGGIDAKVKHSGVKFDPCNGTQTELVTGIDTATADVEIYDVDPAHLADIFGSEAEDLISIAKSTGHAARTIALVGPQSYNKSYVVLWRMVLAGGETRNFVATNASMIADIDLKMSKKDAMTVKISFQLQTSPFLYNSADNGVVFFHDEASV